MKKSGDKLSGHADPEAWFAPESIPWNAVPGSINAPCGEQREIGDPLGPDPARVVKSWSCLGLSSKEIANYFNIDQCRIKRLLQDGDKADKQAKLRAFGQLVRNKLVDRT
ncbi:hypothetical protein [Roseovarius salis]|uniref:hypothetical protein n=1 Tax=Roseovarius salis TaxID=3376063 RepID=UPI0037C73ACA